jgi:hypothetical protein
MLFNAFAMQCYRFSHRFPPAVSLRSLLALALVLSTHLVTHQTNVFRTSHTLHIKCCCMLPTAWPKTLNRTTHNTQSNLHPTLERLLRNTQIACRLLCICHPLFMAHCPYLVHTIGWSPFPWSVGHSFPCSVGHSSCSIPYCHLRNSVHSTAAMKIHLYLAILPCFKMVTSLNVDTTSLLGTAHKTRVVIEDKDTWTAQSLTTPKKLRCPKEDTCQFLFFKGTRMHRKRVTGRECVQGCMVASLRFYLQRGWQCGGCTELVLPLPPPVRAPIPAPAMAPKNVILTPAPMVNKDPPKAPTMAPAGMPTKVPSNALTNPPTKLPMKNPTKWPTKAPTKLPMKANTKTPTKPPTKNPINVPTTAPTKRPTKQPTKAPIIACGTSGAAIAAYINSVTMSNKTLSLSGNTSSDLALKQLVASNNQALSTCHAVDQSRLNQRFAYLAFAFSTGHGGTDWFAKPNECQWWKVTCNINNTVIKLDLLSQDLAGTIPNDVGLWTGLTNFNVGNNQLIGSLPSSIGLWTGLTSFDAYDNQLVGSLPSSIESWTNLTNFDVGYNKLVGSLPSSIGLWTGLTVFGVTANRLVGSLPSSIGAWTRLKTFLVDNNKLIGMVPKEVVKWTVIRFAYFDNNMFNGTMPAFGNNFCPKSTTVGKLVADCNEIQCDCCDNC